MTTVSLKKWKSYIEIFKNFLYRKPATSSEAILADSKRNMVISSTFPNNGIAPYQTIVLFTKRIGVTIFDWVKDTLIFWLFNCELHPKS